MSQALRKLRQPSRYRLLFVLLAIVLAAFVASQSPARAQGEPVIVHLFWQEGCPHCENAKETLGAIAGEYPDLRIESFEIGSDEQNAALFLKLVFFFEHDRPAVPFVVIGDDYVVGHAGGGLARSQYLALIDRCRAEGCIDVVEQIRLLSEAVKGRIDVDPAVPVADAPAAGGGNGPEPTAPTQTRKVPDAVALPVFGDISLATLSLPLITVVLAGIDGFNPCAMWVLVLLIGLLAGVADARRMWTLGFVFLLATGAMYFAVMAAWLNVVLLIGAAVWLRIAIGGLAVFAGLHYLREYWTNPEGVCEVTTPGSRKRLTDAFRRVVTRQNLLLSAIGIAGLAIVVNMIELVCSAGVPAVFTQILAMHDLSLAQYYGYLLLYLAVFLLDDAVIFVTAMVTLRSSLIAGRYSRISHLVGGGLLLALGAVMVLRPEWLG